MSLQNFLYTETSTPDVLERYIDELKSFEEIQTVLHANKLISYLNMLKDKKFQKNLRKLFNEMYDLINKKHPALHFSIAGRIKSLVSVEKKILQYFELDKSLDLIRDFFAFRIILFGNNSLDLVKHCYMVMEDIIEFAATKGFTPCEGLPLIGVSQDSSPQNPYYNSFKYKQFIKDYVCFPKENGYRSLHLVLEDTEGRRLEIQIRTLDMHAIDESGDANHLNYKEQRYSIDFPLDRNKITVHGYTYVNGQVFDFAGVEKPVFIFQRQKTF